MSLAGLDLKLEPNLAPLVCNTKPSGTLPLGNEFELYWASLVHKIEYNEGYNCKN